MVSSTVPDPLQRRIDTSSYLHSVVLQKVLSVNITLYGYKTCQVSFSS